MLAYALDWANLLVRLLHVTAAIAWIGTSFYYIALDYHLLEPKNPAAEEAGVGGEVWEIHGGGFYRVEKYRVAPPTLPSPLVQVGGVHHLAERLHAACRAVLLQRQHVPGRQERRRHQPARGRRDQRRDADRGLVR